MKKMAFIIVLLLAANSYFSGVCKSYNFDKGAILTLEGVMCERTVQSSYDVPILPLEGARRQFEYRSQPDPRWITPAPDAPGA